MYEDGSGRRQRAWPPGPFLLGEVKDRLSECIAGGDRMHDRVMITRHGRPDAVLISPDDLAALEETVDILTTPDVREQGVLRRMAAHVAEFHQLRLVRQPGARPAGTVSLPA